MRRNVVVVVALVVALAILWGVAITGSGAASAKKTTVRTKTVVVAKAHQLRPGMKLTLPAKYHSHRVKHFQWLRCNSRGAACKKITGATHRTYTVRLVDVGHTLRARIVTWQGNVSATTGPTPQVGRPLPVNSAVPVITDGGQGGGTLTGPIVGDVLTGSNGTWQHAVRFTYQWMDCDVNGLNCVNVAGATTNTYTLQDSDVGDTIVFQVTAYNF